MNSLQTIKTSLTYSEEQNKKIIETLDYNLIHEDIFIEKKKEITENVLSIIARLKNKVDYTTVSKRYDVTDFERLLGLNIYLNRMGNQHNKTKTNYILLNNLFNGKNSKQILNDNNLYSEVDSSNIIYNPMAVYYVTDYDKTVSDITMDISEFDDYYLAQDTSGKSKSFDPRMQTDLLYTLYVFIDIADIDLYNYTVEKLKDTYADAYNNGTLVIASQLDANITEGYNKDEHILVNLSEVLGTFTAKYILENLDSILLKQHTDKSKKLYIAQLDYLVKAGIGIADFLYLVDLYNLPIEYTKQVKNILHNEHSRIFKQVLLENSTDELTRLKTIFDIPVICKINKDVPVYLHITDFSVIFRVGNQDAYLTKDNMKDLSYMSKEDWLATCYDSNTIVSNPLQDRDGNKYFLSNSTMLLANCSLLNSGLNEYILDNQTLKLNLNDLEFVTKHSNYSKKDLSLLLDTDDIDEYLDYNVPTIYLLNIIKKYKLNFESDFLKKYNIDIENHTVLSFNDIQLIGSLSDLISVRALISTGVLTTNGLSKIELMSDNLRR